MDDLAALARAAYADGWARTRAPLTERVKTGCGVAVALALEHADTPGVLEATLRLGSLEGTWAAIYDRRGKLYAQHLAAVSKAYRALTATLDIDDTLRRLRRSLGLGEAAPDPHRDDLRAAAAIEATRITHQLLSDASAPEYKATVTAIASALADADAEGTAGAIALAAQHAGRISVDFDLAFDDACAALSDLGRFWGDAQGWLGRVVNGHATDLGNALARALDNDADFDGLRDAAKEVLDGPDIRAVDTLIDLAMGQSFSNGAVALYRSEGMTTCDFLTAGGARVCAICLNAESNNPWQLADAPRPALHPGCRCSLAPAADSILVLSANIATYLTGV